MKIKLSRNQQKTIITHSEDIYPILKEYLLSLDKIDKQKEHFISVGLKNNNEIKYIEVVSIGSLTSTVVGITELFRRAIIEGGIRAIIIAHNHPSGNKEPSNTDKQLTKKIVKAGKLLDIKVLDHLILTTNKGYLSFVNEGLM